MRATLLLTLALCVPLCLATFSSGFSALDQWAGFVSLSQVLDQNHYSTYPGDPEVNVTIFNTIEDDGYKLERINSLGTHTGTHLSAPCHFIEGALCIDALPTSSFVFVAALLDFSRRVATNPANAGFLITIADIKDYERRVRQTIPRDALVILYTGFGPKFGTSAYSDDPFPGFSAEAVAWLFDERHIKGLGSDTFGPDASTDLDLAASTTTYEKGGITIENMAKLQQLKNRRFGDIVVATPALLKDGSGFQTNVIAFLNRF